MIVISTIQQSVSFADVNSYTVVLFSFGLLFAFFIVFALFWFSWWVERRPASNSPYSNLPLRNGSDLSYYSKEMVLRYLKDIQQYDNRMFDLERASFCRETGRVFFNSLTWYGAHYVDWATFLHRRYPGNYVSWGSLNDPQKDAMRKWHDTMEGYQTEISSPEAAPRLVDPKFALTRPGPLYVDMDTKVLLGWKEVPLTELEVLIVQLPREIPKP